MNNKLFSKDEEKRIAEIYSSACSDITAPQELYGKVIDNMTEKKRDINFNWKVAITVAAFMIVILGGFVFIGVLGSACRLLWLRRNDSICV